MANYKEPTSANELVYITNRTLDGGKGNLRAWAYKLKCPKCQKALMGNPLNKKTGRPKIRAAEYECPNCGNVLSKDEVKPNLFVEVVYKCPYCSHDGYVKVPFIRKKFQGVDAFRFECEKCLNKIPITKMMKALKNKTKKSSETIDVDAE